MQSNTTHAAPPLVSSLAPRLLLQHRCLPTEHLLHRRIHPSFIELWSNYFRSRAIFLDPLSLETALYLFVSEVRVSKGERSRSVRIGNMAPQA